MNTSSKKNKGRRLQKWVADRVKELFGLGDRDVRPTPMGVSGDDIQLSDKAVEKFPFSVECKNQETTSIWKWMKQAEADNRDLTPLVVFKRNRSDVYVCMKFDDFMKILEEKNAGS